MGGIAVHIGARWRAAPHPVRSSSPAPSGTWSRARACASWIVVRTTSTTCLGVAPLRGGGLSGLTRGSSSTVGSRAGARRHERHGETSYLGACDAPKKRTSAERAKIRRRRTLSANRVPHFTSHGRPSEHDPTRDARRVAQALRRHRGAAGVAASIRWPAAARSRPRSSGMGSTPILAGRTERENLASVVVVPTFASTALTARSK